MPVNDLLRRSLLVALLIAVGVLATVYFFHGWFHFTVLPAIGLSHPVGDAIGAALIVLGTYLSQRMVSQAFYKDTMYGTATQQNEMFNKVTDVETVGEEVAKELNSVRKYNDVQRQQLNGIVEATEKAAYDITNRLLAIDAVVTRLDGFVAQTATDSSAIAQNSEKTSPATNA